MARSKGKDLFYIPGGKREGKESNVEALAREVLEELGVNLIENTAKEIFVLEGPAHGKPDGTLMKLTCITGDLDNTPTPSSEIEELRYLTTKEKHLTPTAGVMLLEKLKELDLID